MLGDYSLMNSLTFIGMYGVNIPPKELPRFLPKILIFLKIIMHMDEERKYVKGNQGVGCGGTLPRPYRELLVPHMHHTYWK